MSNGFAFYIGQHVRLISNPIRDTQYLIGCVGFVEFIIPNGMALIRFGSNKQRLIVAPNMVDEITPQDAMEALYQGSWVAKVVDDDPLWDEIKAMIADATFDPEKVERKSVSRKHGYVPLDGKYVREADYDRLLRLYNALLAQVMRPAPTEKG